MIPQARTPQFSQIVIDIDEVDLDNRVVHGRDKTNVLIIAGFREAPGAALRVPAQGEKWTAQRIGYQWRLGQRLDSVDEHNYVKDSMAPGDARISADGTLHVVADEILVNGEPFGVTLYEAFSADGTTTSYLLDNTPLPLSIQAFTNGLLIDPRTITATNRTLTFASPPTSGALLVYYQTIP